MSNHSPITFKPGGALATLVLVLLSLNALAALVSAGTSIPVHNVVEAALNGEYVSENEALAVDAMSIGVALIQLAIYLPTVVVFCFWIYRAHKNLFALEIQNLQYTPGWAVGYYFIPFLNLVRPAQVMSEIVKASSSEARKQSSTQWQSLSPSSILALWWGSLLATNVVSRVSLRMSNSDQLETLLFSVKLDIVSSGLTIIAAIALMMLIGRITREQNACMGMTQGAALQPGGNGVTFDQNANSQSHYQAREGIGVDPSSVGEGVAQGAGEASHFPAAERNPFDLPVEDSRPS